MNGTEQKQHSKVTARLADDLDTIEQLLHETGRRTTANAADISRIHQRMDEQAIALVKRLEALEQRHGRFVHLRFWDRLNWLIRGVLQ